MRNDNVDKSSKKSKLGVMIGLIFLFSGILIFVVSLLNYINWKLIENNYDKQYVYSSYGDLYYEINDNKIYVDKIYNTNEEIIELKVPNQKTVIMYCSKDNLNECIYFDVNNKIDQGIFNPFAIVIIILFLLAFGLLFLLDNDKNDGIFVCCIILFVIVVGVLVWQVYSAINYFKLKNDGYVTSATVYSEIYNIGNINNSYKPVSYYYVDNQKYIYVNTSYIDGDLEDVLGETFELFYNKNNPNEACKKKDSFNILIITIVIILGTVGFLFILLKKMIKKDLIKFY